MKQTKLSVPVASLVPTEYLSLLSVKVQFGSFGTFPHLVYACDLNLQGSLYF